jgi:hypothetical protein
LYVKCPTKITIGTHVCLDPNHAPPAGIAGPSIIQLTPTTHEHALSQILNVVHVSTPPAPALALSPSVSSTLAFPFPCTKGGGHESSGSFLMVTIYLLNL